MIQTVLRNNLNKGKEGKEGKEGKVGKIPKRTVVKRGNNPGKIINWRTKRKSIIMMILQSIQVKIHLQQMKIKGIMELTLIIKETKSKTMEGALNNNNRVNLINGIRMYVTSSRINSNFRNNIKY